MFLCFDLNISFLKSIIWTLWTEELDTTFTQLNISSALCYIFLGIGVVFLQPTSMKLGRRFTYLMCTCLAIVGNIVGSVSKNITYLYIFNILTGIACAPVDSLVEITTTDIFFQHERAEYLSLVILALYAGSDLGPVACGYMVEVMSWRWCFYIQIIIFVVLLIFQLFFMEETIFQRLGNNLEDEILHQIASRNTEISLYDPEEVTAKGTQKNNNHHEIRSIENETHDNESSIPLRSYRQRINLIELEYNDKSRSWFTIFYRPLLLVSFPILIWSGILYGSQIMWLSLLGTTQSEIYVAPPYSFSTLAVGLTNLGAFFGSVFGTFYGGKFVDYLTLILAKRDGGIFEADFRLYALVIPTIFNGAGLLAYGIGPYYGAHWAISVVIGQGLPGFAMTSAGSIALTYAVDSFPALASESLVLILFTRNCIACGFTFAIQPWLARDGLKVTTWLMFMLAIIINGSFIFMVIFGKRIRRWNSKQYLKYSDHLHGVFK